MVPRHPPPRSKIHPFAAKSSGSFPQVPMVDGLPNPVVFRRGHPELAHFLLRSFIHRTRRVADGKRGGGAAWCASSLNSRASTTGEAELLAISRHNAVGTAGAAEGACLTSCHFR